MCYFVTHARYAVPALGNSDKVVCRILYGSYNEGDVELQVQRDEKQAVIPLQSDPQSGKRPRKQGRIVVNSCQVGDVMCHVLNDAQMLFVNVLLGGGRSLVQRSCAWFELSPLPSRLSAWTLRWSDVHRRRSRHHRHSGHWSLVRWRVSGRQGRLYHKMSVSVEGRDEEIDAHSFL